MKGARIETQIRPDQVEEFVQSSALVELGDLSLDKIECSICNLKYGSYRGEEIPGTEPVLDQELSDKDAPEQVMRLRCGPCVWGLLH